MSHRANKDDRYLLCDKWARLLDPNLRKQNHTPAERRATVTASSARRARQTGELAVITVAATNAAAAIHLCLPDLQANLSVYLSLSSRT